MTGPRSGACCKLVRYWLRSFALPGGRTGVRADAQETWVVPKPSSDLIPSGGPRARAQRRPPWASEGKPPETTLSMTVTEAAKVQAIVRRDQPNGAVATRHLALSEDPLGWCGRHVQVPRERGRTVGATASMPAYSRTEISSCYALKLALPELGKSVELAELQPNEDSIVTLAEKVLGVPVYTSEERHRIEPTTSPPPATGTGTATGTSTTTGTGTATGTGTTGTGTRQATGRRRARAREQARPLCPARLSPKPMCGRSRWRRRPGSETHTR